MNFKSQHIFAWFFIVLNVLSWQPHLIRAQETKRLRLNAALNIPIKDRSFFSLGLYSHANQLNGLALNLLGATWEKDMNGICLTPGWTLTKESANGLQISGIGNVIHGNSSGLVISTFLNRTKGKATGMALTCLSNVSQESRGLFISGLTNLSSSDAKGVFFSGVANISAKNQKGLALSGIVNLSTDTMKGVQASGVMNVNGKKSYGCQLSSVSNVGVQMDGVQISSIINITQKDLHGFQMGCGNYAGNIHGVQLGLLNLCGGEVKGCQIGIINHSKDTTACKIGLVNINPKTRIQLLAYAGNNTIFNLAAKFKNKISYTILGLGTHFRDLNKKYSGSMFYRAGLYYALAKKWELSGDIGFSHIQSFQNKDTEKPDCMYSLQGRLNLECQLHRMVGLFASIGYAHTRYYKRSRFFEQRPIFEFGLSLF